MSNPDIRILVGATGGANPKGESATQIRNELQNALSGSNGIKVSVVLADDSGDLSLAKKAIDDINNAQQSAHNNEMRRKKEQHKAFLEYNKKERAAAQQRMQNNINASVYGADKSTLKEMSAYYKQIESANQKIVLNAQKQFSAFEQYISKLDVRTSGKFTSQISDISDYYRYSLSYADSDALSLAGSQFKKLKSDVDKYILSEKQLQQNIAKREQLLSQANIAMSKFNAFESSMTSGAASHFKNQINDIKSGFYKVNQEGLFGDFGVASSTFADTTVKVQALKAALSQYNKEVKTSNKIVEEQARVQSNAASQLSYFNKYIQSISGGAIKRYANEVDSVRKLLSNASVTGNTTTYQSAISGIRNLQNAFRNMGAESGNIITHLEHKFKTFAVYLASSALTMGIVNAFRNVINVIYDLDSALVDLRIVTGSSIEQADKLIDSYNRLAKRLGTTTSNVANAAVEWQRQGFTKEDTDTLLTDSTALSIVGMMESEDAAKALTSAMKGYQYSVEDAIDIVDMFTAVDMVAATSAGDIATALSKTAANAHLAGIELNSVIGQLARVNEVMQESPETTGTFYNTMLSRMGMIKAGRLSDPETGESLSDVESTLNGMGVQLRESNSEFKNFGEVLDEVGSKWDSYSSVQQRAIATAFAGTRQQTRFITLMEGWDEAMEYSSVAADSTGTSMEKLSMYQEGLEAKQNKLTASFENFSRSIANSSIISFFLSAGTAALDFGAAIDPIPQLLIALGSGLGVAGIAKSLKTSSLGQSIAKTAIDLKSIVPTLQVIGSTSNSAAVDVATLAYSFKRLQPEKIATILAQRGVSPGIVYEAATLAGYSQAQKEVVETTYDAVIAKRAVEQASISAGAAATKEATAVVASTTATEGAAVATHGFSSAVKGLAISLKSLIVAHPIIAAIAGSTAAIFLAVKAFDALTVSLEEQHEQTESLKDDYNELSSTLSQLNDELDSTESRIRELSSYDSLTFVEQEELNKLKQQKQYLEDSVALYEKQLNMKGMEVNESTKSEYEKYKSQNFTYFASDNPTDLVTTDAEQYMLFQAKQYQDLVSQKENIESLSKEEQDLLDDRIKSYEEYLLEQAGMFEEWADNITGTDPDFVALKNHLIELVNVINNTLNGNMWSDNLTNAITDDIRSASEKLVSFSEKLKSFQVGNVDLTSRGPGQLNGNVSTATLADDNTYAIHVSTVLDDGSSLTPEELSAYISYLIDGAVSSSDVLSRDSKSNGGKGLLLAIHPKLDDSQSDSNFLSNEKEWYSSLTKAYSDYYNQVAAITSDSEFTNFIDQAREIGIISDSSASSILSLANSITTIREESAETASDAEKLVENLSAMSSVQQDYEKVSEETSKSGHISFDTLADLAEKYADLKQVALDYVAGKADESDILDVLSHKYSVYAENIGLTTSKIEDAASSTKTYLDQARSSATLLDNLTNELSDTGTISFDSLSEVLELYGSSGTTDLTTNVAEYVAGLKTASELLDDLSEAYQVDADNFAMSLKDKLYALPSFYNSLTSNQKQLVDELGKSYGVDLENFTTVEEKKLAIQSQIINSLAMNYAKYAGASLDTLKSEYNMMVNTAMSTHSLMGIDTEEMSTLSNAIREIEAMQARLDSIASSGIKSYNYKSFVKPSSSSSSSSKNEVDLYIADIDALYESNERLKDLQTEMNILEQKSARLSDDEYKKKIENSKELIKLRSNENKLLNEQNNIRRSIIKGNLSKLSQYGFEYSYDPANNDLIIKNMEHINQLYAGSIEETNELRKNIEDLIDTTIQMNDDAVEASENWQENLTKNYEEVQKLTDAINEFYSAWSANQDHQLNTMKRNGASYDTMIAQLYANMDLVHQLSEESRAVMREAGMSTTEIESSDIIRELQQAWQGYLDEIQNLHQERYDAMKDLLDLTKDMIVQEKEDMIDALEEQKSAYADIIDLKKKSIELTEQERSYQEELDDKSAEMAKLQARIDALSLDDSREAQIERGSLLEQLAELQKDLEDTQREHSIEAQKDALDEDLENFESQIDDKIDVIEDFLDDNQKLTQEAMDRINNEGDALFDDLLSYAMKYTDKTRLEIETMWDDAKKAAEGYASYADAMSNSEIQASKPSTNPGGSGSASISSQSIVAQMKQNSQRWSSASASDKAKLEAANQQLAAELSKVLGRPVVRGGDGRWYYDRVGGTPVYHTGGVVGASQPKQNELFTLLEKGEAVLTKQQQNTTITALRTATDTSKMFSAFTSAIARIPKLLSNTGKDIDIVDNITIYSNDPLSVVDEIKKHKREIMNILIKPITT